MFDEKTEETIDEKTEQTILQIASTVEQMPPGERMLTLIGASAVFIKRAEKDFLGIQAIGIAAFAKGLAIVLNVPMSSVVSMIQAGSEPPANLASAEPAGSA